MAVSMAPPRRRQIKRTCSSRWSTKISDKMNFWSIPAVGLQTFIISVAQVADRDNIIVFRSFQTHSGIFHCASETNPTNILGLSREGAPDSQIYKIIVQCHFHFLLHTPFNAHAYTPDLPFSSIDHHEHTWGRQAQTDTSRQRKDKHKTRQTTQK